MEEYSRMLEIDARSVCSTSSTVDISSHILGNNLDVLSTTQTWLNEGDLWATGDLTPSSLTFLQVPISGRRGSGGLAFLHRSALCFRKSTLPLCKYREANLTCDDASVRFVVIYNQVIIFRGVTRCTQTQGSHSVFIQHRSAVSPHI